MLEEFRQFLPNWSMGLTVLIGVASSQYSSVNTILAIFFALIAISLSALSSYTVDYQKNVPKKSRNFNKVLIFSQIWFEALELLAVAATCARITSATFDYISKEKFREWLFGIESHSFGEPWPDVVGVFVIVIVCGLMMLGLERNATLSTLLAVMLLTTFTIFISLGIALDLTPNIDLFKKELNSVKLTDVISATTLCCYGFINTIPEIKSRKMFKVAATISSQILFYIPAFFTFISVTGHDEMKGTATPLLRLFELKKVTWAQFFITPCLLCTVCLVLTEVLPNLCELFVTLADNKWKILLTSLQYRNDSTGAPILAIFAAGSLAAILAFACPLEYLLKILPAATLSKCISRSFFVLFAQHTNDNISAQFKNIFFGTTHNALYNKIPSADSMERVDIDNKRLNDVNSISNKLKRLLNTKAITKQVKRKSSKGTKLKNNQQDEYLLLDDYCDNSVDNTHSSKDNDSDKNYKSSDEESSTSTDIDSIVEEYKEKIQFLKSGATVFIKCNVPTRFQTAAAILFQISTTNFQDKDLSNYTNFTIFSILLSIIVMVTIYLSQILDSSATKYNWIFVSIILVSSIIILLLPKNEEHNKKTSTPRLIAAFSLLSLELNLILISTVIPAIWPGYVFWVSAGGFLYWRCECCTCDGLENNEDEEMYIVENMEALEVAFLSDSDDMKK